MCSKRYVQEDSIGALGIVTQNWKPPRCSSTVEGINYSIYIYTVIQRDGLQQNENEEATTLYRCIT